MVTFLSNAEVKPEKQVIPVVDSSSTFVIIFLVLLDNRKKSQRATMIG